MRFFKRKYSKEKGFQLAKEFLRKKPNVNKRKDINLLNDYLKDKMIKEEISLAVDEAYNEVFSLFNEEDAFHIAMYMISKYSPINQNRLQDESIIKNILSSDIDYKEIQNRVDNLYRSYLSRYSKEEALEIGKPYLKELGPIESNKKLDQLITYYRDDMKLIEIQDVTKKAYLNEFGKLQGVYGFRKRKINNKNAKVKVKKVKPTSEFNKSINNKILDVIDVGIDLGAEYFNSKI